MQFLDSIIAKARSSKRTIVLAEGEDPRIIEAAQRAQAEGIADCVLLGDPAVINRQADTLGMALGDIRIDDPSSSQYHQRYSEYLHELRKHKGLTLE